MYFKNFLKYRKLWLGIAMIWIISYHRFFTFRFAPLNMLQNIGYAGADICLFASGIGCYYSLSSDPDVFSFMKRRIKRLMVMYLIFIIPWLAYQYFFADFGWQMALGNLFAVQSLTTLGCDFNWYISGILLFYLITPYLKGIVDSCSAGAKIVVLILLIALSVPFWNSNDFIIIVSRLPIYYIGVCFGKICRDDCKCNSKWVLLLSATFICGIIVWLVTSQHLGAYLWSHALYWYPFILITPPLCMMISFIAQKLEKTGIGRFSISVISLIGDYSFEVYLLHIPLVKLIYSIVSKFSFQKFLVPIQLCGLVCLIIGCYILRRLTVFFTALIDHKRLPSDSK